VEYSGTEGASSGIGRPDAPPDPSALRRVRDPIARQTLRRRLHDLGPLTTLDEVLPSSLPTGPPAHAAQAPVEEAPVEEPAQGTAAPDEPAAEETHWIAFKIIDEETGAPQANVKLKVKLPGGEIREVATDGAGVIEIRGIDPGAADIEEMVDAHAFEVIAVE